LDLISASESALTLEFWTVDGRLVQSKESSLVKGANHLRLDYSEMGNGLFLLKVKQRDMVSIRKLRMLKE